MQTDEAAELRETWEKAGNPPCDHETVSREYFKGSSTGDYVCTRCGREFARSDLPKGCTIL